MADAALNGVQCDLVSWGTGGNLYATILSRMRWASSTLTMTGETHDVTAPQAEQTGLLGGLRSWTLDISGEVYTSPRLGNAGLVTFSSGGYTKFIDGWSIVIECPVHDITAQRQTTGDTTPTWRTFMPDKITWTGGIEVKLSDTTAFITPPAAGAAFPTFTGIYGDSATDESFSGAVHLSSQNVSLGRGRAATAVIGYQGSSTLTSAGTSPIWPAGTVGVPTWTAGSATLAGPIVLASKVGSRTFTGEDSFVQRFEIACRVNSPVMVNMRVQGCGSMVTA